MTLTVDELCKILEEEIHKYNIMLNKELNEYMKIKLIGKIEALRELYSNFLKKEVNNQNELWLLTHGNEKSS